MNSQPNSDGTDADRIEATRRMFVSINEGLTDNLELTEQFVKHWKAMDRDEARRILGGGRLSPGVAILRDSADKARQIADAYERQADIAERFVSRWRPR